MGSSRNLDLGNQFGMWSKNGDQATLYSTYSLESIGQFFKGECKGRSSTGYQQEITEPSYLSSSIYYGRQENYSLKTPNSESQHMVRPAWFFWHPKLHHVKNWYPFWRTNKIAVYRREKQEKNGIALQQNVSFSQKRFLRYAVFNTFSLWLSVQEGRWRRWP